MGQVLIALVPGILAMFWFFGPGILINITIAAVAAISFEALAVGLRGRNPMTAISDLSALVTAVLLAICLPPLLPWWLTVLGTAFAIVLAKQIYGGLGYNPFNPAMAGYVFLLVSYPVPMTSWLPPTMLNEHSLDFMQTLTLIFTGTLPAG